MTLEDEVKKLMNEATGRSDLMLRATTGLGEQKVPDKTDDPYFDLLMSITSGHRAAIERIAREIDNAN